MGRASRVLSDMEIRGGDNRDAIDHAIDHAGGDVGTGGVVQKLRDDMSLAKLSGFNPALTGTRVTGKKRTRGGGYDLDEEIPSILVWQ